MLAWPLRLLQVVALGFVGYISPRQYHSPSALACPARAPAGTAGGRRPRLGAFKVPRPFPGGDYGVELALLGAEEVHIVINDLMAKRVARPGALFQVSGGLLQGV